MKHTKPIRFLTLLFFMTGMMACHSGGNFSDTSEEDGSLSRQLPRALFITTGLQYGNGTLPKGLVIALQALNQKGVVCRMESREILYDRPELFQYNILVLSTALGYHDADRTYSLTFMSDEELEILREFVGRGGVLVAGDNLGRNYPDGTDRVAVFQQLTSENFPLADCLGGRLVERYMDDHHIELTIGDRLEGSFREKPANSKWALVMDSVYSDSMKVLGHWILDQDTLPALTQNRYEKGTAFLLATSDFLEPVNSGGEFSSQQISDFYHYLIDDFQGRNHIPFQLNPWPQGFEQAFCVSLNANGTLAPYQRVFDYLEQEDLNPVVFTNGLLDEEVEKFLLNKEVLLGSSGYGYQRYSNLNYPNALLDMVKNENHWGQQFSGFRFPYTSPSHWGLMALDKKGVQYESSIGANNLAFFHGAVVPYNLVVSTNQFFTTTDILEVAPVYHDDFHFYKDFLQKKDPRPKEIQKAVQLYQDYLLNFWEMGVKPYQGAMVYLGHPAYLGKSDTTMAPLQALVAKVKQENTWLTSLNEIARFRHQLSQVRFVVKEEAESYEIAVKAPAGIKIENLSLRIPFDAREATARYGIAQLKKRKNDRLLVFSGEAGQMLKVWKAR
jgi:hypothetical protein